MNTNTHNSTNAAVQIKPTCIVYDLDGCVVDSSNRLRLYVDHTLKTRGLLEEYYQGLYKWSQTTQGDVIIPAGVGLVRALIQESHADRVFALTARGEEGRPYTLDWLQANMPWQVHDQDLIMNVGRIPDAQGRVYNSDAPNLAAREYKQNQIQLISTAYNILYAIDDHPDICQMYEQLRIPTIRCVWPDIECLALSGDLETQPR